MGENLPHFLPPGTRALDPPRVPLSARGCVALAACARPACFILSSAPFLYSTPCVGLPARSLAVSSRPSFLRRLSPWKSAFTREINFSRQRQGSGRRPLGSETTGISGSVRKGSRPALSERECGPTRVRLPEGARSPGRLARCAELPVAWPRVSAGKELLGCLSVRCRCLPQPERRSCTLLQPWLRPQDVQKECLEGLATHSSEGERQTWAGEVVWMALTRCRLPRASRAAWKSPGLGSVGNGFLAPQPNCSTFWTDSLRLCRCRPEPDSLLEQREPSRANGARQSAAQLIRLTTQSPARPPGGWRGGRGVPGVRTPSAAALARVFTSTTLLQTPSDPPGPCFASLSSFPSPSASFFPQSSRHRGPFLRSPTSEGPTSLALTMPWSVPACTVLLLV